MKLILKSVAFGIGLTVIISAAVYGCIVVVRVMGNWGTWYSLYFSATLLSVVFAVAYYLGKVNK